ncbi:MAG: hypothetical protein AAF152_20370 [Cyanobacteria bacterium P01_A01_bin.114]
MKIQLERQLSKLAVVGLLITPGIVSIESEPAYGCSCMQPESALVERDRNAAVFAGEVSGITPTATGYTVDFTVSDQWKGDLGETVQVTTADNSAACGYYFEVGQAYLVYAYGDSTDLSVGLCSRTTLLENAAADIAELAGETSEQRVEPTSECF